MQVPDATITAHDAGFGKAHRHTPLFTSQFWFALYGLVSAFERLSESEARVVLPGFLTELEQQMEVRPNRRPGDSPGQSCNA